jgi:hypothetical protein
MRQTLTATGDQQRVERNMARPVLWTHRELCRQPRERGVSNSPAEVQEVESFEKEK